MKNDKQPYEIPPCLKSGPLSKTGTELINESNKIPKTEIGDVIKTLVAYGISQDKERAFSSIENPTTLLQESLLNQTRILKAYNKTNLNYSDLGLFDYKETRNIKDIRNTTAKYYGELFKEFNPDNYFNEATEMLKTRLLRNNIFPKDLDKKSVLDAGCGGGKYSVAWKKIGAQSVTGIDFSKDAINGAIERLKYVNFKVNYRVEDIENLTFSSETFDVVYCYGVLHHLSSPEKAISELLRVLKKNGLGWFYLIESPGGYNWDIIEILRMIMNGVNSEIANETLKVLKIPPNKIFRLLDHALVPVNIRYTKGQIFDLLNAAGAENVRFLERGMDFDRLEKVYNNDPFADLKYGCGHQFVAFTK